MKFVKLTIEGLELPKFGITCHLSAIWQQVLQLNLTKCHLVVEIGAKMPLSGILWDLLAMEFWTDGEYFII